MQLVFILMEGTAQRMPFSLVFGSLKFHERMSR